MEMSAAGKGDDYRPTDINNYNNTLNEIFGKKCPVCNSYMSRINSKYICDNNKCNHEERT